MTRIDPIARKSGQSAERVDAVLAGGGEMGALMRAYDWTASSVGPPSRWPQSLRTTVRLMLGTNHPVFVFWGPQLLCFYNDAYRRTMGPERHPATLGAPGREVWAEIWDIIGPDIELVMGAGGSTWSEDRLVPVTRNGRREDVWWTYSYSPIDDEASAGGVGGVLVICNDVTAQHEAREALSRERARLLRLFQRASGFILVLYGPRHEIGSANDALERLVGPRELLGRPAGEALADWLGQGLGGMLDRVYQTGQARSEHGMQVRLQSAPGTEPQWRYLDLTVQALRDEQESIIGVLVEGRDVTAAKQHEMNLRQVLEENATIFAHSLDLICTIDASGDFQRVSARAKEVLGYTVEELVGRAFLERVVPQDVAKTRLAAAQIMGGMPLTAFENRYLRKDGSVVHVLWSAAWVPERQTMIAIARDLSERMKTEEVVRQAQKAEAIGQLTGGVAHDFNNLLTVILGNAELLADELESTPHLGSLAALIVSAAERGAALTQSLLAFAQRQALATRSVDVNRLVAGIDLLLRRAVGEHVQIVFTPQSDLWPGLVDPALFEGALLNLAINARDAMPAGGQLTIETRNTQLDTMYTDQHAGLVAGDYVMLAITDSGCGMSAEVLSRMFEPYYTTKARGKGTGLGMSMVHGFIKQSGGHVSVYSEVGEGTTVKMYLPRAVHAEQQIQLREEPAVQGGDETILLVEDDDLVRSYAHDQLVTLGYAVLEAASGPEALQILEQRGDIDLLFTDVMMPGGMNGRELAQAAQRERPALKVLYTSGYSENALIDHGRLDPAVCLLSKPYPRSLLAVRLREALSASD